MIARKYLFTSILAALATSSFAAPTLLGTISLDYLAQAPGGDGTFLWQVHGTTTDIVTYCMSTNNYFAPWESPQVYKVWSIAGASGADVDASGMLSQNSHPGLNGENLLDAAALAASYGSNPGIAQIDADHNAAVHSMESTGDGIAGAIGVGNFFYLEQDNPSSYAYHGQPMGYVGENPPTPEPASLAAIGVGVVGLLRRRRKA